jgi:PKD repeat protein
MKRSILLLILIFPAFIFGQFNLKFEKKKMIPSSQISADQKLERCGTTKEWHENRMQNDEQYRKHVSRNQKMLKERKGEKNPDCIDGPIIIPVAVHFNNNIVQPDEEACVINLVIDQINSLNTEYGGNDPDNSVFANLAGCFGGPTPVEIGAACIEFCLAQTEHPIGYGLLDGDLAVTFGQVNFNNTAPFSIVPLDPNWAGYLNIFIDDFNGGLLGISAGIPGNFSGEGVLIDACTFGTGDINCPGVQSSASCGGIYDEGNTLTHEMGHYLGLVHIWGDGGCGANDGISDTPLMSSSYVGYQSCNDNTCPDLPGSCGSKDMYMNYMSYASDACMYMFTSEQADVMYQTAVNTMMFGDTLPNSCKPPGPPDSDFNFTFGEICPDECITFTDNSNRNPDSWNWGFNVTSGDLILDINNSTDQNPMVCITEGTSGIIEASLTASNLQGTGSTVIQTVDVTVLDPDNINCGLACPEFSGGPYIDFILPNSCELGCPVVESNLEVWENEAYLLLCNAGLSYTFEFCNGYDALTWPAVLTVSLFDAITNTTVPNTAIQVESGCSITFTAPITALYIVSISGDENCGGAENQTDNGLPTFFCNNTGECPCPTVFQDKSNGANGNYADNETDEGNTYLFCPNGANEVIQAEFTDFDIESGGPTGCYDSMEVYDGPDTNAPQIGALYCGATLADAPGGGLIFSTHSSGCLTFVFNSDSSVGRPGWVANIECVMAPIPVELIDFTAEARKNHIKLDWSTASEINNKGFELLRKSKDSDWTVIDFVDAKENSSSIQSYGHLDYKVNTNQRYYYQLNQKDIDGRSTLSNIATAQLETRKSLAFDFYPNPVIDQTLNITSSQALSADVHIQIFNVNGNLVNEIIWTKDSINSQIQLDISELNGGVYFAIIKDTEYKVLGIEKLIKY